MYVKLSKDLESFKLPDIVKIHGGKWINGLKKVHYGPNILSRSGGNVVFFLKNNLATYHDRYYFLYFSVCYYLSRYCMVLQGIFWYFSLNFSYTNYSIPYTRTRENVIVLKVFKVSICVQPVNSCTSYVKVPYMYTTL